MDTSDEIEADVATSAAAAPRKAAEPPQPRVSGTIGGAPGGAPVPPANSSNGLPLPFFSRLQKFFDVDTADVLQRAYLALNPLSSEPFLINGSLGTDPAAIVGGKLPDLWGPVWIYQSTVFAMFLSTSIAGIIVAFSAGTRYEYNISLLTGVAAVFFMFTFAVPLGVWLLVQWWNLMPTLTLAQVLALYGYSNVIWVPMILVMGSPLVSPLLGGHTVALVLRWVLAGVAFAATTKFIVHNLERVLKAHASAEVAVDRSKRITVLVATGVAQAVLTVSVVSMFSAATKYGK